MHPQQGHPHRPGQPPGQNYGAQNYGAQNYGAQNYGVSSYRGGFMPSHTHATDQPPTDQPPSGTTTWIAAVLSAALALAWIALLIFGLVDDPDGVDDHVVLIAFGFIVPMLPVVLGTILLLARKPAGRGSRSPGSSSASTRRCC